MENLKNFNLEDDYLEIKESLEYPTLSLTDDNGKVWVKEYENYITAHYIIGNVYDSGVEEDSVDSLGMTNVVGGMQHYSRKIVSTNFVTSSNVRQSSNNGIMMLSLDEETPQIMTLSDNGSNYENITIDTNISLNNYCGCIVHCDETAILNKQIQSLKIKTNCDVSNGNIIPLLFYYRDEPQYDNLDGGDNCSNCNNNWAYDEITQDVFDNINTYFTFEDNNTLVATQEYIDYINQYIDEYNNIFAVFDVSNFETIDFQLIIDDVYTLNVHNVTISKYELQVFDYYETEILKYISEIHINGERQSEVAPYYYIISETNEFDVKIVFNTSNIPSMYAMFEYCDALTWVDFKHLKLDKGVLKDTSYMFSNCYSLIELKNLEYFDTSNVINMRGMFQECYSIGCTNGRGLKPSGGSEGSVDNLGVMPLSYNIQPYEIEQPEYNGSSSCQGGTIDIKHDNNCSTSYFAPTYDSYVSINAINGTSKLTFNGDVDENNDMVVCICISRNGGPSLESLNAYSYGDCEYIEETIYVPLSSFTKVNDNEYKFNNNVIHQIENDLYYDTTHISFIGVRYECMDNNAAPKTVGNRYATDLPLECCIETQLYCECVYCTFDLSKLNVSNVQNMSRMFQYCNSVHYINMSTWNTSNVSDMYQMFSGCESLLELDFYNFNLGKLTDFGSFISNCYSLNFINMNCYMNPNTEYSNNSYNLKENGTIVLNENYTYNEYFLNDLTNYNWNILPSQLDYKLIIVENGLEVTEGSVLVNDEVLTYNSESGKWEGVTLNVNDVNVIITYNDNEYDININSKYLFVGDNNSSYSGFNITIKCGISDYNEKIYFINSAYTKYIEIMLVDNKMELPNYYIINNNPIVHEIKIIFNLKKLTSLRCLFTSFIEGEFYYYPININEIIFSDNFITTNIVDISYLITNDCFVTINDNFDFKNILNAKYAFNNCHINISNLKLDDLINNGNYNNMLDYSHVIYDCENEYQKRIIDNSNVNELICNNINYQIIIVENGLEVTEGTVLCNNSELIYNSESGKWEGNIILDDFDININYNNSDYKISYYLDYLFIGYNNETYNKINIIETCNNYVNLFINEQYKYNVKFVLLDGKQIKTSSLEYKTCYNNNIKLYDNNSHKISLYFDISNVTDMSNMFYDCYDLTSIDLSNFDTSNVTNMYRMFYNCNNLTSLYLSNFDTSNVTDMSYMFYQCYDLTSLDLSNFDTSNVTNMYCMFSYCSGLTSLDLSNFDTSNVTSMSNMFQYCSLTSLDLSSFDTSNVTIMSHMFCGCSGLISLDVTSFDTSKVTNMNSMFNRCSGLTSLDLSNFDTSNVTDMGYMFYDCYDLTSIIMLSDVSKVTSYSSIFGGLPSNGTLTYPCTYSDSWNKLLNSTYLPWTKTCQSSEISVKLKFIENGLEITEGNVVVNNTTFTFNSEEQVWEGTYIAEQQVYSVSLNDVEVGSVNHKFNINYVFIGNNNGSYSGFTITETVSVENTGTSYRLIYNNVYYENYINHIQNMFIDGVETTISSAKTFNSVGEHTVQMIMDASNITSMSSMFYYCNRLTSLDLSNFDTSNVTNMYRMFRLCTSLTSITFGNKFDASNVTRMDYMFESCSGLTSLDLSSFDTSNVTNMSYMFQYCKKLTSLDLNSFDTSKVTDMSQMFYQCSGLTSLDLSSFNTSKVNYMSGMFGECNSLTSLDLSNFNTSKVTNMESMFANCYSLTSLDLSSFDTSNVYNMNSMFERCSNLISLDLTHFNTSKVTNMEEMFYYCRNLTSLDLSNFNTSNVTTMRGMFYNCRRLTSLNVSSFDTSKVTNMEYMFRYCPNLTSLDLSSFDTSKVTNMSYMFRDCSNLSSITFGDKADVFKVTNMEGMFYNLPLNLIFNYDCNYDYFKLLNYNNTNFNGYANCLTKEQTWLLKVYDYANNDELITDLTLTLSNGVQGVYDETKSGYIFTFTNVKDIPTYDVLMNGEVIGQIRCDDFEKNILINLSGSYIKEIVNVSSTNNSYSLISETYLSYISEMYIDSVKQDTIVSNCTFNNVGEHEIIYIFDSTQTLTSCTNMFVNCNNLTSLDLSNFDASNVNYMNSMFYNCSSLTSLDLSNFDTSKVTTMYQMFYNCRNLTSLDLSSFDTSNVTIMEKMFYNCSSLTELDLSNFDTSKVTYMNNMFYNCSNLKSIIFGDKADVSKVTSSYSSMFRSLPSNGTLTYPCAYSDEWDRLLITNSGSTYFPSSWTKTCQSSEVTNKIKFIENGVELTSGDFIVNDVQCVYNSEEQVWEVTHAAEQQVTSVLRDGIEIGSIDNVNEINYLFIGDDNGSYSGFTITETVSASSTSTSYNLIYSSFTKYIDVMLIDGKQVSISSAKTFSSVGEHTVQMMIDTSNLTNMQYMFSGCTWLTSITFGDNFDTSNVTSMSYMFSYCNKLTSLDLSNFDTSKVTSMSNMFSNCTGLTSLDLTHFDTSNVTYMSNMFTYCYNLTSLDLTHFDTSNVYSMSGMFCGCYILTSLNLSSFDTSNVTFMNQMFIYCYKLTSLDLTHFDTSNVTDMSDMFNCCSGLTSLNVSSFNTSKVTTMNYMFRECSNLTSLDLSNFDTSNVYSMSGMFYECSGLTSLNVSSFNTSKVTNMYGMFRYCSNLTSLDLSNFDTSKVTDINSMFYKCNSLTSIEFGYYSDVSKVTSSGAIFSNVPSSCTLTLCNNTVNSWNKIISSYTLNTVYIDCIDPSLETNE